MKRIALFAALAFAACQPADREASAPDAKPATSNELTPAGWGALKIGMTKAEVIAAVGDTATPDAVGGPDPDSCEEFHPSGAPEGLFVMIEDGKLARLTLAELGKLKTADGFGLGDDPAAIKAFYGARAVARPHQYQGKPAEYVTVWEGAAPADPNAPNEGARGFVYEVDGTGKVGAIHAGSPAILYVEGCA